MFRKIPFQDKDKKAIKQDIFRIEKELNKYQKQLFDNGEEKSKHEKTIDFYTPILNIALKSLNHEQNKRQKNHELMISCHKKINQCQKVIRQSKVETQKIEKKNIKLLRNINDLIVEYEGYQEELKNNNANNSELLSKTVTSKLPKDVAWSFHSILSKIPQIKKSLDYNQNNPSLD